jgi:hypothetical protein
MSHSFVIDSYAWVKSNGIWRIESTTADGKDSTLLPEGVIPARAPCRFDETPDFEKWKKTESAKSKDLGSEISAR